MDIRVSVVVPTYERTELLGRCLTHLVNQQFEPKGYEIILVTDGPDNTTHKYINGVKGQYSGHNIRLLSLGKKAGPAAARNMGWQQAKGELVLFTDDDCIPDANWVQSYWSQFDKMEAGTPVAFTGKIQVPLQEYPTDFEKNTARLEEAEFVTANCACTKKVLEKINGFDESFTMAWREDSDLHFKLMEAAVPLINVPNALIIHPARQATWGVSIKDQKKGMFNALLYKKHPRLYKERVGACPLWNYYLMIILFVAAAACFAIDANWAALTCFCCWAALVASFAKKRLAGTSPAMRHVMEMLVTSICIPFLSVYWTLYGSLKFKKLLL